MKVYAVAPPPIIIALVAKDYTWLDLALLFLKKEENTWFFFMHCLIPKMSVLKQLKDFYSG